MWIEVVGWVGMVMLLLNFYLASHQYLDDTKYLYHFLNIIGAVGVMINAFNKGVLAVGFIEVAWSVIALVGVYNVYRYSRGQHELE